jgi:hypothetical protein
MPPLQKSFYEQFNKLLTKEINERIHIIFDRLEYVIDDEKLKQILETVSEERNALPISEVSSKTKKKKVKDPNMPKRPQNAYMHYFNMSRPLFVEKYPDAKPHEICKHAAKEWSNMTVKQKTKYEEKYKKEREEYAVKMEEYNKSLKQSSST